MRGCFPLILAVLQLNCLNVHEVASLPMACRQLLRCEMLSQDAFQSQAAASSPPEVATQTRPVQSAGRRLLSR